MKRQLSIVAATLLVSVALTTPALAGWVFTDVDGSEAVVSNGRMKTDAQQGTMIVNADGETLTMIDTQRKVYATSNVDELCNKMKASIDEMMKDIPAEQRAMFEKQMAANKTNVKIVDLGDGGKVSGFDTHHYEIHVNGKPHEELWIADNEKLVSECRPAMMVLAQFGQCMAKINPMVAGGNPMSSDEYVALYEKGMTVKSSFKGESRGGAGLQINSVEERDVPDNTFQVPEGYEQITFEQMFGMQGR